MAWPRKYDPKLCKIAMQILAEGKSLAAICAKLDIARSTLYEWRDIHPEFKYALDCGLQKAQAALEQIGMDGIVGNYEKFNGSSWIFTMKNRFRDDYAEDKEEKSNSQHLIETLIDKLVDK